MQTYRYYIFSRFTLIIGVIIQIHLTNFIIRIIIGKIFKLHLFVKTNSIFVSIHQNKFTGVLFILLNGIVNNGIHNFPA